MAESGIDSWGMCVKFYQTVIFVNGMPRNINIMCKGRLKSVNDYSAMWFNFAAFCLRFFRKK